MAKFSFHCENFKATQLNGIDKHNRRLNNNYLTNPDIEKEKSINNHIYIEPKQSLYTDCKNRIQNIVLSHGGRITKASNWITECIFSYPDELPIERLDEYNNLIIKYMGARLGEDNIIEAVCHLDEAGLPHLHLDIIPITEDCRLSTKTLITRDFITSVHNALPLVLQHHGFDVERGEETENSNHSGRSAKEYKKAMEIENKQLNEHIETLAKEYNDLIDKYNKLLLDENSLKNEKRRKEKELAERNEIHR